MFVGNTLTVLIKDTKMKKNRLSLLMACLVCLFWVGSYAQEAQYEPPKLGNPDSWSLVLMPDPQSYVKFERNQGILELMTGWISEQIEPLNIGMVLCTGDLVEHNDWLNPNGTQANQPGKQQ